MLIKLKINFKNHQNCLSNRDCYNFVMTLEPTTTRKKREGNPDKGLGDLHLSKTALANIHRAGVVEAARRSFPGMKAAKYSDSTWEFHADYAPVFSCLGVPENYVPYLVKCAQIFRTKFRTAMAIATARICGIPWCDMRSYIGSTTYNSLDPFDLKQIFDKREMNFVARVETGDKKTTIPCGRSKVSLFDCTIMPIPQGFFNTPVKFNDPTKVGCFALFLPDEVMERKRLYQLEWSPENVPGASAYVFYEKDGNEFRVMHFFDQLHSYSDEPSGTYFKESVLTVLLSGFEAYARYLDPKATVSVVGGEYVALRDLCGIAKKSGEVPGHEQIMPKLFAYKLVPLRLGYKEVSLSKPVCVQRDRTGQFISFDTVQSKSLSGSEADDRGQASQAIQSYMKIDRGSRFRIWGGRIAEILRRSKDQKTDTVRDGPTEATPGSSNPFVLEEKSFEPQLGKLFEMAPYRRSDCNQLGLSEEQHACLLDLLELEDAEVAHEFMPADRMPISRGKSGGVSSDPLGEAYLHGNPGWDVNAVHAEARERHPSIRLTLRDESGAPTRVVCIGVKGGGMRDYFGPRIVKAPGLILPFSINRDDKERSWGAACVGGANLEFLNTLLLHMYSHEITGQFASCPIPLDSGVIEKVPVWGANGKLKKYLGEREYRELYLHGEDKSPLGAYRSIVKSDIRVSQLIRLLFNSNPEGEGKNAEEALTARMQEGLRVLYFVNGHGIKFPDSTVRSYRPGLISWKERCRFLKEVYESNRGAADKILEKIELDSLRTIAVLHGVGGHFGGDDAISTARGVGASNGNGPAIRNTTICGELTDHESSFTPGLGKFDYKVYSEFHALRWEFLRSDLRHWESTMFWLRLILRGNPPSEIVPPNGYPFGKPGNFSKTIHGCAPDGFRLLVSKNDFGDEPRFKADSHNSLYHEVYRKARRYGIEHCLTPKY